MGIKTVLRHATTVLEPLGYRLEKSRFIKTTDGFFKQVHFQPGAHGDYFFIEVCLHLAEVPLLLENRLVIPEKPLNIECIIRQRIEQIVSDTSAEVFKYDLVSEDNDSMKNNLPSMLTNAEHWFNQTSSYSYLLTISDSRLFTLLNVVPALKMKAAALLRCICAINYGTDNIEKYISHYINAPTHGMDLTLIDEYVRGLASSGVATL
jgi:hypothetical protein